MVPEPEYMVPFFLAYKDGEWSVWDAEMDDGAVNGPRRKRGILTFEQATALTEIMGVVSPEVTQSNHLKCLQERLAAGEKHRDMILSDKEEELNDLRVLIERIDNPPHSDFQPIEKVS